MKKTAIIYDKWLSSLGGGEVVACNYAKILSDIGYETTLICGKSVDKKIILQTLNIDLSNVKIIENWNDESNLTKLTKKAHVFINTSFLDYSLSQAKLNILYIFFPNETDENPKDKLMTRIVLPTISYFIKPVETLNDDSTETRYAIYYLDTYKKYQISFKVKVNKFSKTNISKLKLIFSDAHVISNKIYINHFTNTINYTFEISPNNSTIYLNVVHPQNKVDISFTIPEVITFFTRYFSCTKYNNRINQKLRAGIYKNTRNRINNYQVILATSDYTKEWIQEYWNVKATTFYAPVPLIIPNSKIKKKNQICSIGRFFTTGHGKKQDIMITAFKKLYDHGLKNWELHLAGGLGTEKTSLEYANNLKKMSQNYPIFFHFNEPRNYIENLYLESKIYWHAAGFGIDKNKEPIKFEHFGITPIEAMSAGCIPVLFNGGGLSEVVDTLNLDRKIHLFSTTDELVANTQYIIKNNLKLPADYNKKLSKLFGYDRFKKQLLELINNNNHHTNSK